MNTLKEVKEELRMEISALREAVKRLNKTEDCGVDKYSGLHTRTGKYDEMRQMEVQLETAIRHYKLLTKVRKLR